MKPNLRKRKSPYKEIRPPFYSTMKYRELDYSDQPTNQTNDVTY